MKSLENAARALFESYGKLANQALKNPSGADIDALVEVFSPHFVGASPAGVIGGSKDESFPAIMRRGFDNYRAVGGTRFEIVGLDVERLDDLHAMVLADWEFDYVRPRDGAKGTIAFRNIYFVTFADGEPRIFAWITPDEAKAMKDHGLV